MTRPVVKALTLVTDDGVAIDTVHLPGEGDVGFVIAHGFTLSWQHGAVWKVASRLQQAGSVVSFDRIALHAARVRVPRPDGSILEVCSPVPALLREWWRLAGGDDGAWDAAMGELTAPRG